MKSKMLLKLYFFLIVCLFQINVALAQSGNLDPSFDLDGKVMKSLGTQGDYGVSVALQSDGKIVVAGSTVIAWMYEIAVLRFNTDGSLDSTFDADGIVITSITSSDDQGNSLVIQPDGKIVVGGSASDHFAVLRYNTDGSLDSTFDSDGISTTTFGSYFDMINSIQLQPDGKIVGAGTKIVSTTNNAMVAARFNTDGSLDTTFDSDGKVTIDINAWRDECLSSAIQADGKIVLAGCGMQTSTSMDFALVRYNSDGSLDSTFDADGILINQIGTEAFAFGIAVQPDGKIVATGRSKASADFNFTTARYNNDGSPDSTFDSDGLVITPLGATDDFGSTVLIQPDGKILTAGGTSASYGNFALVCYNSDGSLDTTFDSDGIVTTPFGTANDYALEIALQSDGKIVAVGCAEKGADMDIAVARYYSSLNISVAELDPFNHSIVVFPNPISDWATIQSEINLKNASMVVSNSLGQVVKTAENLNGLSFTFYREGLTGGLYFISLVEGGKVYNGKIVVADK